MEDSTAENARSRGLTRLHEMVMGVKSDREVGLAYMKWYEIEKRVREEGRIEGKAEGKVEGKAEDIMELLEEVGAISEKLEKRVREQKDLETLRNWLKLAAHSESIEEFEGLISDCAGERAENNAPD